jgi:PRTRC genetic system protein B
LYFRHDLKIPNGEYSLPGLVWMVNNESLSLYAYRAKHPAPDTQLYKAPFFNVYHDGSVCLGNASLKLPENITFQNFIKHWENKFFLSEFSQILGNNPVRSNLVLLFKNSVNSFDSGELLPVKKMKLKNLLK